MRIVTRAELDLPEPTRPPLRIGGSRRSGVVLHWNGPPMGFDPSHPNEQRERRAVRAIVDFHRDSAGWSDGAYSFIAGHVPDVVYEVRGDVWDQFANGRDVVGADDGNDREWYSVMCLIGEGEEMSPTMEHNVLAAIDRCRANGAGMRVLPHSDFKYKACPGPDLTRLARRVDNKPTSIGPPGNPLETQLRTWAGNYLGEDVADPARYSAAVELWQRMLRHAGHNPGPIDGRAGAKTVEANRRHMRYNGLSPTDRPTTRSWSILLRDITRN